MRARRRFSRSRLVSPRDRNSWRRPTRVAGLAGVLVTGVLATGVLTTGGLLVGCGEPLATHGSARVEERPPNILIFCIDTLRADHVGAYGHSRPATPAIDRLARAGVRFEQAQATAPWTVPSVASILTSLMPSQHGSVRRGRVKHPRRRPQKLSPDVVTLAGVLGEAGYRTAFLSGNAFVRGRLLEDFDAVENTLPDASTIRVEAERWLAADPDAPFFLYLQPFDLHVPIEPPRPYADMFETASGSERREEHGEWHHTRVTDFEDEEFLDFVEHKRALYDGALRYIDDTLALLLAGLSDLGVADRTFVVVTSDHGEEFWDHAEIERRLGGDPRDIWGVDHGHSFFQELVRIPLIVSGPGIARGRTESCPFTLLDLAPTLLELVGVPPARTMSGRSRAALLRSVEDAQACDQPPLFAESPAYGVNARSVLYEGRYKLIQRADGAKLLYDLEQDPAERTNLAAERPEILEELVALLRANRRPVVVTEEMDLDPETVDTLRSLGYLD